MPKYRSEDERRQLGEEFPSLCAAIAKAMSEAMGGDRFTVEESNDPRLYAYVAGSDGLKICLHLDAREGRVSASPSPPQRNGGYSSLRDWGVLAHHNDSPPSASCDVSRPVPAIARAICSKVVTPYAPMFAEIVKRRDEQAERAISSRALAIEFAELLGKPFRDPTFRTAPDPLKALDEDKSVTLALYGRADFSADLTVHSYGKLDINLRSVAPELARAICKLLAATPGESSADIGNRRP